MKKLIFLIILFSSNINSYSFGNNIKCDEFKKFSMQYFNCKGTKVKNKAISAGKNIIKDTKEYQNKEWNEEKKKMNKVKEKINKTKEKVLN